MKKPLSMPASRVAAVAASKADRRPQPTPPQRDAATGNKPVAGKQSTRLQQVARGRQRPKRPRYNPLDPARVSAILDGLAAAYPNAECALVHRNPWELLVATILSAQCTDARVNLVTPTLFDQFPTPAAIAEASPAAIEEIIRPTGFFHNKAKSISGAAKRLAEFHGEVPRTMAELLTVPGAARKTANVVLGVAYGLAEGVVVDTHVLRLSRRLELTVNDDPKKVELELMAILPRERWIAFSHEMIHHGRQVCVARKPRCVECMLEKVCNSGDKTWSSH